jgi:hypothetical protein
VQVTLGYNEETVFLCKNINERTQMEAEYGKMTHKVTKRMSRNAIDALLAQKEEDIVRDIFNLVKKAGG